MANQAITRRPNLASQEWLAQVPKISDALKKGASVSVVTWAEVRLGGCRLYSWRRGHG